MKQSVKAAFTETYTAFSASRELALGLLPSILVAEVRRSLALTGEARALLDDFPETSVGGARDVRRAANHAARGGVLDGPFESYFRTGRPSDKGTYENGLLEGAYEAYWSRVQADVANTHSAGARRSSDDFLPTGDLMERGVWSAGKPCGEWYRYLPTNYMGNREGVTVQYPACPGAR